MRPTAFMSVLAGATISFGGINVANADTGASSDEVRAMVAEMLADAETRSSLLQTGSMGGHDGKFFIASPDGNFRLNLSGQVQFRYTVNFRDDTAPSPDPAVDDVSTDDFTSGFQTRRTRLQFDGHVFQPELFYSVMLDANRDGGSVGLLDAFVGYDMGDGFKVRWGQFKLPFLREELIYSKYQLAADRSLTNAQFSQGRSQAIEVSYSDEMFRAMAAFSDGFRSANTDIGTGQIVVDPVTGDTMFSPDKPADWAFTGRIEALLSGEWNQFRSFSSPQGSDMAIMVGGAAHIQSAPDTGMMNPLSRFFAWTVDASLQGDGWNAFGAFIGRHDNKLPGSDDIFGYVIQGGLFLSEELELFGRWDHTFNGDDFRTITGGFNYYLHGHAAKFTMDVQWFLDDSFDGQNTGVGFLTPTDDDQVALRFQFQLLF
ncbi:MAG: hypothetical protein EA376_05150 [Phycisphaeraceae bacterium]|nr:MAG: hypothetical protein EA376_05150 [Phycisphaeraceae bacterium]